MDNHENIFPIDATSWVSLEASSTYFNDLLSQQTQFNNYNYTNEKINDIQQFHNNTIQQQQKQHQGITPPHSSQQIQIANTDNSSCNFKREKKAKFDSMEYHKKHREKKKDYVKGIENQIIALKIENEQLTKENQDLRNKGEGVDIMRPNNESFLLFKECSGITNKMKEALDNNDEMSLIYLLHLFHMTSRKVYQLCESDVLITFHPNMQLVLASMSYIPSGEHQIYNILSGDKSDLWLDYYKKEAGLTIEQSNKLDSLRDKFSSLESQCLKERLELDREIKRFYHNHILMIPDNSFLSNGTEGTDYKLPYISEISQSPFLNSKPLDTLEILDFINKLTTLQNKILLLGRLLMMDLHSTLSSFLTRRQEALFYVRINQCVSFDHSRFDLLNDVWTNIISKPSVFDVAESLEKYYNTNNTGGPSIPFSLKPASFNPPFDNNFK